MIIPVKKKLYNPREAGLWWPGKKVNFRFSNAALLIPGCGCCITYPDYATACIANSDFEVTKWFDFGDFTPPMAFWGSGCVKLGDYYYHIYVRDGTEERSIKKLNSNFLEVDSYDTGGHLYFIKTDGTYLYVAGDKISGKNVWCLDGNFGVQWSVAHLDINDNSYVYVMEVFAGDGIYLGGRFGSTPYKIRKLALSTGAELWSVAIGGNWFTSCFHSDGTHIVAGSEAGSNGLHKVTVGGTPVWTVPRYSDVLGSDFFIPSLYILGGNIWCISTAYDTEEGYINVLQQYSLSDGSFIDEDDTYQVGEDHWAKDSWMEGSYFYTFTLSGCYRNKYDITGDIGYNSRVRLNLQNPSYGGYQCIKDGSEYIISLRRSIA